MLVTLLIIAGVCMALGFLVFLFLGQIVTLAARLGGGSYVKNDITVTLNLLGGRIGISQLELEKAGRDLITPFIPLPFSLSRLAMKKVMVNLNYGNFLKGGRTVDVVVDGIHVDLEADDPQMWNSLLKENKKRLQECVDVLRDGRVANANWSFTVIEQRIDQMKKFREERARLLEIQDPKNYPKDPVPPPAWKSMVDKAINGLTVSVSDVSALLKANEAVVQVHLDSCDIEQASDKDPKSGFYNRKLAVDGFSLAVDQNAQEYNCVLDPMSVHLQLGLPGVMETLLPKQSEIAHSRLYKLAKVAITIPDIELKISPGQVIALVEFLKVLTPYSQWWEDAAAIDRVNCRELSHEQSDKYKELFRENKIKECAEMEKTMTLEQILTKRVAAKDIEIPPYDKALSTIDDETKMWSDISRFSSEPLGHYDEEMNLVLDDSVFLRCLSTTIKLQKVGVTILDRKKTDLLQLGIEDIDLSANLALYDVDQGDPMVDASFSLFRMFIKDRRHDNPNKFPVLFDRNPDCKSLVALDFRMLKGGMEVDVRMGDFTFVVNLEPIMALSKEYQLAIEKLGELSATLDDDDMTEDDGQVKQSNVIYECELPPGYNPVMLSAFPMTALVTIKGWELCLPADPMNAATHTLTLTADLQLSARGTKEEEDVVILLSEVALRQCELVQTEEWIEPELDEVRDPLLLLDAEGVDVKLEYHCKLTAPLPNATYLLPDGSLLELGENNESSSGDSSSLSDEDTESIGSDDENVDDMEPMAEPNTGNEQAGNEKEGANANKGFSKRKLLGSRRKSRKHNKANKKGDGRADEEPRTGKTPGQIVSKDPEPEIHTMDGGVQNLPHEVAERNIYILTSPLSLRLSRDDLTLFGEITEKINQLLTVDEEQLRRQEAAAKKIEEARNERRKKKLMDHMELSFRRIDVDGSGYLDKDEVIELVRSLVGKNLTESETKKCAEDFFEDLDTDRQGDISFEEYMEGLQHQTYSRLHCDSVEILAGEYVSDYGMDAVDEIRKAFGLHVSRKQMQKYRRGKASEPIKADKLTLCKGASRKPFTYEAIMGIVIEEEGLKGFDGRGTLGKFVGGVTGTATKAISKVSSTVSSRGLKTSENGDGDEGAMPADEVFKKILEQEVGISLDSLRDQRPAKAQKKLIKAFRSFDFAAAAWEFILMQTLPPKERTPWLVKKTDVLQGSANVARLLMKRMRGPLWGSSGTLSPVLQDGATVLVKSVIVSDLGNIQIRIADQRLPPGVHAIELILHDMTLAADLCVTEGIFGDVEGLHSEETATKGEEVASDAESGTMNDPDSFDAKFEFGIRGAYYNTIVHSMEPFIEPYWAKATAKKQPNEDGEVQLVSTRYFVLNVTAAFLETLKYLLLSFGAASSMVGEKTTNRKHISEIKNGVYWLHNETGLDWRSNLLMVIEGEHQLRRVEGPRQALPDKGWMACKSVGQKKLQMMSEKRQEKLKNLRKSFKKEADNSEDGTVPIPVVHNILLEELYTWLPNHTEKELEEVIAEFLHRTDKHNTGSLDWPQLLNSLLVAFATANQRLNLVPTEKYRGIFDIAIEVNGVQLFDLLPESDHFLYLGRPVKFLYRDAIQKYQQAAKGDEAAKLDAYQLFSFILRKRPNYKKATEYLRKLKMEMKFPKLAVEVGSTMEMGTRIRMRSILQFWNRTIRPTEVQLLDKDGNVDHSNPLNGKPNEAVIEGVGEEAECFVLTDDAESRQISEKVWRKSKEKLGRYKDKNATRENEPEREKEEVADDDIERFMVDSGRQLPSMSVSEAPTEADAANKERFFTVAPNDMLAIPIHLVDAGSYRIRQQGETEWSNSQALSTKWDISEALKKLKQKKDEATSSTIEVTLPELVDNQTIVFMRNNVTRNRFVEIDDDADASPVENETAAGKVPEFDYTLALMPQFVVENVLPCSIEYIVVQPTDVPEKSRGNIESLFKSATKVNARRSVVPSGQIEHVSGLDMTSVAFIKMRMFAGDGKASEAGKEGELPKSAWSSALPLPLGSGKKKFEKSKSTIKYKDGRIVTMLPQWDDNGPPTVVFYVPYWIKNQSGIRLNYKGAEMTKYNDRIHEKNFGTLDVPIMFNNAIRDKLSIKASENCLEGHTQSDALGEINGLIEPEMPPGESTWSKGIDVTSLAADKEVQVSDEFTLGVTVSVVPGQFYRTKLVTLMPRWVFRNYTKRTLDLHTLCSDKKGKPPSIVNPGSLKAGLKFTRVGPGQSCCVYRWFGPGVTKGIRIREQEGDEFSDEVDLWSVFLPVGNRPYHIWSRGPLGEGPLLKVEFHYGAGTNYIFVTDATAHPPYRIDNRSSHQTVRYRQQGLGLSSIISLPPLTFHQFAFPDALEEHPMIELVFDDDPFKSESWSLDQVRPLGKMSFDGGRHNVFAEVFLDDQTLVLSISDINLKHDELLSNSSEKADMATDFGFQMHLLGMMVLLVDDHPSELMNISIENIDIVSPKKKLGVTLTIHHLQIDDMTVNSRYPVVFAPAESGYNSDRKDDYDPSMGEWPFLKLQADMEPTGGIPIFHDLELVLSSFQLNLNVDFLLEILDLFMNALPDSDPAEERKNNIDMVKQQLKNRIHPMENWENIAMVFLENFKVHGFWFDLVFISDPASNDEDGLSQLLGATLANLVGGIAHMTPTFNFSSLEINHKLMFMEDLIYAVIMHFVKAVLLQWYKVVGSFEMFGDPVGFVSDVSTGMSRFAHKTAREITGKSKHKGEGAKILVQTVVGCPFDFLGKSANGMGNALKRVTYFESQEDDKDPQHLGQGILQGGKVFGKSIAHGVKNVVKHPINGLEDDGGLGLVKGVGRGMVGLVASPLVGVLGGVEKFSLGVKGTTMLLDEMHFEGTRRPARDLAVTGPLKPLTESNVATKVEVYVARIEGLELGENDKTRVYVNVGDKNDKGEYIEHRQVHKSHKKAGPAPKFGEVFTMDVLSTSWNLEIVVKKSRFPSKLVVGRVELSLHQVFEIYKSNVLTSCTDDEEAQRLALVLSKVHTTRKDLKTYRDFLIQLQRRGFIDQRSESEIARVSPEDAKLVKKYGKKDARPSNLETLPSAFLAQDREESYLLDEKHIDRLNKRLVKPFTLKDEKGHNTPGKIYLAFTMVNDMRR